MCGRFTLTDKMEILETRFGAKFDTAVFIPRYNAAPSQSLPVILNIAPKSIKPLVWGLRPVWLKRIAKRDGLINVRDDTLREKNTFKKDLAERRCLVLADSFYEWKKTEKKQKTPYRFQLKTGELFAFAGLWEENKDEDGHMIQTFVIITVASNPLVKQVHDRMPAILERTAEEAWLNGHTTREDLLALLHPYPAGEMQMYEISPRVNRASEESPDIIQPVRAG